jgi:DNA (cytosine-5)-methyltransferase 1
MWPTPTASEDAAGTIDGNMQQMLTHAAKRSDPDGTAAGGQLNPTWVEWLMGFPPGWTDCEHLGMPSFRKSLKSSGGGS